jgi:hypothetical protein
LSATDKAVSGIHKAIAQEALIDRLEGLATTLLLTPSRQTKPPPNTVPSGEASYSRPALRI